VPIPLLPEAFTAVLELDRTAALVAAFLIGNHHADILLFAARMVRGDELQPRPRAARRRVRKKANGGASKSNGTHKPDNGDLYLDRRREARDRDDELLLEVMRKNPEGSIGDWATTIHKSRTSCVSALHRLRDAGLAESAEGKWRLVESEAPRAPRWVEPVSALGRREHAGG
jgi:hypothetical protein